MNTKRMKIETGTRNVKQHVRRFTDNQRRSIIDQIENRPPNVTKTEMFLKFGMSRTGGLYYHWKKMYGNGSTTKKVSSKVSTKVTVNPNVPMNTINVQRMVVEVNITSVDVLFKTIKEINKIKGVKSVSV